jgi:hypothetical protein
MFFAAICRILHAGILRLRFVHHLLSTECYVRKGAAPVRGLGGRKAVWGGAGGGRVAAQGLSSARRQNMHANAHKVTQEHMW